MDPTSNITPWLFFPKGYINPQEIAKARVKVPLNLITSMDSSVKDFIVADLPSDVEEKASRPLKVIHDSLAEAISGDKLDWRPNYGYIHVEYHFKVPISISFTMFRQRRPYSDWSGTLAVKIDCAEVLVGNEISCDVTRTRYTH